MSTYYNDNLCHLGRIYPKFEKRNDLAVSKQTTKTRVIKIYSIRTRDPLRQRKEISSTPKRDETSFPSCYPFPLKLFNPTCISMQTAY
ncbi:hypothetical protein CEXT_686931 [Caerostris extrusa]|uniref:Uncharacterized protein n=1 Tax=Caerostris extrusa TaxID=172846 RepID=A0AAV4M9K6_CAEEX|nr:hypothetical protein CEXT_686931 [Caerostris extrusa]